MAKNTTKQVNAPPMATEAPVTETALTAQDTTAKELTTAAPVWLQKQMAGRAPLGLEKMDQADLVMSRLVLAQAMSPEVTNADENGYGIQVGDIFDNLTKEIRAKAGQPLEIIPIVLGKARIHFGDLDSGEGILCRSDDALTARPGGDGVDQGGQPTRNCASCVLKEFDEEGDDRPACSLIYNIVCLLPQFGYIPCVWGTKHTGVKVAKRFLSSAKLTGADLFAQKYVLRSTTEKSDKYTYKNFDFKAVGWVGENEYMRAREFHASLEGKTWAPDTSDLEAPTTPPAEKEVNPQQAPAQAAPAKPAKAATVEAPQPPISRKGTTDRGDIPF